MMKNTDYITRHSEVSEKAIEKHLTEQVEKLGGLCLKYSNPNKVGYPDRVICLPHGKTVWVELKSKGRKPTKLQTIRQAELVCLGHEVYCIDNKQTIDELIKIWKNEI